MYTFSTCTNLEEVRIKNLKVKLEFKQSSKLSVESILYMIKNSVTTTAITITLHATAYARAIVDADIITALTENPLITLVSE